MRKKEQLFILTLLPFFSFLSVFCFLTLCSLCLQILGLVYSLAASKYTLPEQRRAQAVDDFCRMIDVPD
jgi:hypothetical protein